MPLVPGRHSGFGSTGPVRACVVAEVLLDRQAIVALLTDRLGWTEVTSAENDARAIWAALRARPAFVLVSGPTARPSLVDAVQMILRLTREAHVIVLGASADAETWQRIHPDALVDRDLGIDELRIAVESVRGGRKYASRSMRVSAANVSGPLGRRLTRRESELLPLLARGMTLRDAAAQLSVSYKTADAHRTRLLKKLGVKGRVELARFAIREKIIDP